MANYTAGSTRVVLQQPDLTTYQGNGSVVLDSQLARPLWFDGRFLAASDLEREQNYFLQRQANLGRAGGFGVMHGLLVDQGTSSGQPATAATTGTHAHRAVRAGAAAGGVHCQSDHLLPNQYPGTAHDA